MVIYVCVPLIYTPLPNSTWLHHTALRYVRKVQHGAYMWLKGLNSVKTGSKWAHFTGLSLPNGSGSHLDKNIFHPFFTHFLLPRCPLFKAFLGGSMGQSASPWAQIGLKTLV